jgi:hypothetical protein
MKKLLLIIPFIALSCKKDCDCGTIKQKTYLGDGLYQIHVKMECNKQLDSFIIDSLENYNINDKYCY